jgi:hypothetical protein
MSDDWNKTERQYSLEARELRAENEHLRTQIRLLTQIIELEFARRLPRSEQVRKVHEIINSLRHGFHKSESRGDERKGAQMRRP